MPLFGDICLNGNDAGLRLYNIVLEQSQDGIILHDAVNAEAAVIQQCLVQNLDRFSLDEVESLCVTIRALKAGLAVGGCGFHSILTAGIRSSHAG